jgi:hypothetical protein
MHVDDGGVGAPSMRWLYTLYTGPRRKRSGMGQLLPSIPVAVVSGGVLLPSDDPTTGQLLASLDIVA